MQFCNDGRRDGAILHDAEIDPGSFLECFAREAVGRDLVFAGSISLLDAALEGSRGFPVVGGSNGVFFLVDFVGGFRADGK